MKKILVNGQKKMNEIYPFWTSEFSIGESILTIKPQGETKGNGPKSILDIAKNEKEVFLVETSMGGFLTAYNNFKKAKIPLRFGLKLTLCRDGKEKNDESRDFESKVIIFLNNSHGYENLIKIWNRAAIDNFYYYPRADCNLLQANWSKDLTLVFPFYSSFLAKNCLYLNECLVDHSFTEPIFSIESSELPFDNIINKRVSNYCEKNSFKKIKTRSIYYDTYDDFLAFMVRRCIHNRSYLDKPELEHFSSNKFCYEEYKHQQKSQ